MDESNYFEFDEEHPIPNLGVVDINVVKKGGGSDLIIVIASPLTADARSLERLLRKVEVYLEFMLTDDFRRESGIATPENTRIVVKIHRESAPEAFDLLYRNRLWVHNNSATLVVDPCLPELQQ